MIDAKKLINPVLFFRAAIANGRWHKHEVPCRGCRVLPLASSSCSSPTHHPQADLSRMTNQSSYYSTKVGIGTLYLRQLVLLFSRSLAFKLFPPNKLGRPYPLCHFPLSAPRLGSFIPCSSLLRCFCLNSVALYGSRLRLLAHAAHRYKQPIHCLPTHLGTLHPWRHSLLGPTACVP